MSLKALTISRSLCKPVANNLLCYVNSTCNNFEAKKSLRCLFIWALLGKRDKH